MLYGHKFQRMVKWWQTEFVNKSTLTGSIPEGTTTIRMDFGYTPLGTITVGGVELTIPEGSTVTRIAITMINRRIAMTYRIN